MVRKETLYYSTRFGKYSINCAYSVSTSWCSRVWLYFSY